MPALSAHVLVRPGEDCHAIRRELEQLLDERFEIEHTTLQVDHAGEGRPIQVRRLGAEEHPERLSDQADSPPETPHDREPPETLNR